MKTYKQWLNLLNKDNKEYINQDQSYRDKKLTEWLETTLLSAKKEYYTGEPIMSDSSYDKFEEMLKRLNPDSSVLQMVGYKEE